MDLKLKSLTLATFPSSPISMRSFPPGMCTAIDWSQTRAFALPSDQHGWVRINLRGREAQGARRD